jgi:hypothetical protein
VREKEKPTIALLVTDLVADGGLSLLLRGADNATKLRLMVGRFVEGDVAL